MREADLGEFYVDADGNVWQLVSYTDQPTATLRRIDDPDVRVSGVVGSPILQPFRRLYIEQGLRP